MDILYGRNPVLEALRAGRSARKLVVAEGVNDEPRLREIFALAATRGIAVETAARRRLQDIAHTEHHQGIAGYFHSRAPRSLDDVLDKLADRHDRPGLLLVLDGIQDPHNLGALTRTADAVGVDAVLIPKHRAAQVTPSAVKAAAGATEHVPVVVVGNIVQALERLGEAGFWRVGLAAEGSMRYDKCEFTGPTALVVGAEGEGMRALTQRTCDAIASIPMIGQVASLNATVAGSLLMYEAARQRGFAEA